MFDAPRDLVWQAWTDPEMLAQWFGPRGFTSSVPEWDLRVGGALRIVMHGPDGNDYPMKGMFTRGRSRRSGWCLRISRSMATAIICSKATPRDAEREGGKTTMVLTSHAVGRVPFAPQMLAGMEAGWTQSIDKLGELVRRA